MTKKISRRKKNRREFPYLPVGIGVVVVVIALLLGIQGATSVARPQNLSSIPMAVNYPAPELRLENVKGGFEALTDYRNKVLLVNNWATWCPPCKAELPTLVAFYQAHAAEGLMIVGIEAGEPASEVANFVQQAGIPYPIWLDPQGLSNRAFQNSNLPNSYVIDRTGTVRLSWTGQITREMLEKYVTPLLAEK